MSSSKRNETFDKEINNSYSKPNAKLSLVCELEIWTTMNKYEQKYRVKDSLNLKSCPGPWLNKGVSPLVEIVKDNFMFIHKSHFQRENVWTLGGEGRSLVGSLSFYHSILQQHVFILVLLQVTELIFIVFRVNKSWERTFA